MNESFKDMVDLAMAQPGRVAMRPVVEKELLHYDIFFALDAAGLLKDVVFQGGTSLRLCRGSSRFSEDLDFAGGRDFTSDKMVEIKDCIEKYLGKRYGLTVDVKPPKDMSNTPDLENVKVHKWQVSIQTAPERPDLPRQRIKLEIANIPAHTSELVPLRQNYDFLKGYGSILVRTETLDEVLADKVVAFAASTKHIRHRDIWDIAWLGQQKAELKPDLVMLKVADYKIDDYPQLLDDAIASLPGHIDSKEFHDQMIRFIDADTVARTLKNPDFLGYLKSAVGEVFSDMAEHLTPSPTPKKSAFRM